MNVKLDEGAYMPTRAHSTDAGLDLYSPIDFTLFPGKREFVDTGVHIELPENTVGYIKSRSGLMKNHGIITDGTIDPGYIGSIGVTLINTGRGTVEFKKGDRIAQIVLEEFITPELIIVNSLKETDRGINGFGSTGLGGE